MAQASFENPTAQRTWDARLGHQLALRLRTTRVTPNHLTTLRLLVGLGAAAAFTRGSYGWANLAALLFVVSSLLDHGDGELARLSGRSSRIGHLYDLASDALVTVLMFVGMGIGVAVRTPRLLGVAPALLGAAAGGAVALTFWMRMRLEDRAGKSATRQAAFAGFETEDVLYLLPVVTLCNATSAFLIAAAIGAPLFALWVLIGAIPRPIAQPAAKRSISRSAIDPKPQPALARRLCDLPARPLRQTFIAQGAFIHVPEFLPPALTARIIEGAGAVRGQIHRNYLPKHKQGGSVSRHVLDERAPFIGELYRSRTLIGWLEALAGEPLQLSPPDDPHAYALYFYTRPGDHIGWHYDRSYYRGRRYTVLLGVIDESSCRLDYELHTRDAGVAVVSGSLRIAPGGLVFFDGDKLRHRITPLGPSGERVSLTFEYVTDPRMHPAGRVVSNLKDAIAYFGFRQVFRRVRGGARADAG